MDRVAWEISIHSEVERWYLALPAADQDAIAKALDALEATGPTLGRPFVDVIKASRHQNMKELRSSGGHFRLLFAFDRTRAAFVCVGGDKRDDWSGWYERNVPLADLRYDEHLATLKT